MKLHTPFISGTIAMLHFSSCSSIEPPQAAPVTKEASQLNTSAELPSMDYSSSLHIRALARRVSKNSPQLRAAKFTIAEAKAKLSQAGRRANPTLGMGVSKSVPGSEGEIEISFSQRFPITNKLSLQKRVSADQLGIAQEEVNAAEQQLITAAQLIAVEILQLRDQTAHIDKQISSLQKVTTFIDKASALGELSPLDAAQTKLEVQTLRIKKQQLVSNRNLLTTKLKKYIGLPATTELHLSGSLPSLRMPSQSLSLSDRADFRAKLLELRHSKNSILLEKSKRLDDVEVSVSGALSREEDAPHGLENEGSIGVEVSIPLPIYDKNEGNIDAAKAKAERRNLERAELASEIRLQVSTHKQEMLSHLAQNTSIRNNLLPLAKNNSSDLENAYKNGQGNFTSFLKSKTQELDIQTTLIENNLKFHQARVKYFAALGRSSSAF